MYRYEWTQMALEELPQVLRREIWDFVLPRRRYVWKLLMSHILQDIRRSWHNWEPKITIQDIRPLRGRGFNWGFNFKIKAPKSEGVECCGMMWRPYGFVSAFVCNCGVCQKAVVTLEAEAGYATRLAKHIRH